MHTYGGGIVGQLDGKKVVIIGASGGIGYACAEECIAEGASVYGSYRNGKDKLFSLSEKTNGRFTPFELDLSHKENIIPVVKNAVKELGGIDILINAAGISKPGLLYSMSSDIWEDTISTNLTAIFHTMKAVIVPMLANKGGAIINISSVYGMRGGVGQSNYCASKSGVIALSKTAALELASKNIRVNVVAPGYTDTEMLADIDENKLAMFRENIPMKRFGKAKEVAELCVFLSSNKGEYITGQTIAIDGGMTAG